MPDRIQDMELRMDDHWAQRVQAFQRENPEVKRGGVIMLGDSLTEHFPLNLFFPNQPIINRGIAGDTVEGVAARIDLSVRTLAPARVLLMIGINDLLWGGLGAGELAKEYDRLLYDLAAGQAEWKLYVQSMLPTRGDFAAFNPTVTEFNTRLTEIAENHNLLVIDTWAALRDKQTLLREECTWDGLHLNHEGYRRWAEEIAPLVKI